MHSQEYREFYVELDDFDSVFTLDNEYFECSIGSQDSFFF